MEQTAAVTVYRKDYQPPQFRIDEVDLRFELGDEGTRVRSCLSLRRNPDHPSPGPDLVLDGEGLELRSISLDGRELTPAEYELTDKSLRIANVPERFSLVTEVLIHPEANTALEGLYRSGGMFCSQCEAEGFRHITFFADRPDVLARFTTTIVADGARYPVLLSNGNPDGSGVLDDGRSWARWRDPFPKPCYLFALVAGNLSCLEDEYVTTSGRRVILRIYVEPQNADKCDHAMRSLKRSMKWDEDVYGREYDLDVFHIVAVDDFNMGAMENKGLNVFNSKYVLARPDTATDDDYTAIEGVIGHEYFHNWTGNRVTCRDWFQLSLKEGLTVFRDQEFSADMASRAVKRIGDVQVLRVHQFAEDAGPMAHPVRPDSYMEINNFYTSTVYNKGAEVVRMMHTLLGPERFRAGMDLYFERHDGQAVSCDDFVAAMEDASAMDLSQFRLWYSQAGTPRLHVSRKYDATERALTLEVAQETPATPGQAEKLPVHLPMAMALLGSDGREMPLQLEGEQSAPETPTRVLQIRKAHEVFRFVGVREEPVPSLLRGFSAPVCLDGAYEDRDLAFLAAHDSDAFNRWEAGQQLALRRMLSLIEARRAGRELELPRDLADAFRKTLTSDLDPALIAKALVLPSESYVADQMAEVDVDAIHFVRNFLRQRLAETHREELLARYRAGRTGAPYSLAPEAVATRSLTNVCLAYLSKLQGQEPCDIVYGQFRDADNMTDSIAALAVLSHVDCPERRVALDAFYARWKGEPLVVDKWLGVQAMSELPGTLDEVVRLTEHEAFDIKNPNKVRALIGAFCGANAVRFHEATGAGYRFLADNVLRLDALNPQVAARMTGLMSRWRRYDEGRRNLMRAELARLVAEPSLSRDVYEVATKSLA
ncbi:MAG TPA: aminopeptidase N [Candidatus Binatia bacterium]|nr:aminopeptidase N [Candidatus Binatia bacterium]